MNREIKFKCARFEGDKWTVYAPTGILEMWMGPQLGYQYMQKDLEEYQKGNLRFLEFTGLKDKNGKEIYEGDVWVVKSKNRNDYEVERIIISIDLSRELLQGWRADQGEIIGNIYENPELLNHPHP